jgi:hypothetical protein
LFDVLEKFGVALKYIDMIHILFVNVESCVNVNGCKSPSFQVQCGVR